MLSNGSNKKCTEREKGRSGRERQNKNGGGRKRSREGGKEKKLKFWKNIENKLLTINIFFSVLEEEPEEIEKKVGFVFIFYLFSLNF